MGSVVPWRMGKKPDHWGTGGGNRTTNELNDGKKRKVAALLAAGYTAAQIGRVLELSSSHVHRLCALPVVRAESERLFMIWFMDLMNSRIGDIPPHPGID